MGYGSAAEREFEEAQGQFAGPGGNEPGSGDRYGDGAGGGGGNNPGRIGRARNQVQVGDMSPEVFDAIFGGPPSVESFFSPTPAPAPAPAAVDVAGPPVREGHNHGNTGDLYRDYFDPNVFYGPNDVLQDEAVSAVGGGFLTNTSGFFGLREKLVEDPTAPGGVRAEISFDPIGAIADLAGTAISFATGGLAGLVAGRAVSNAAGVALNTKTPDEAVRDFFTLPGIGGPTGSGLIGAPSDPSNNFTDVDGADWGYSVETAQQAHIAHLAGVAGPSGGTVADQGNSPIGDGLAGNLPADGEPGANRPAGAGLGLDAGEGKSVIPLVLTAAVLAAAAL